MILKQRHTPLDRFLLREVFPMLHNSPLRPLTRAASMWHTAPRPDVRTADEPARVEILGPSALKVA